MRTEPHTADIRPHKPRHLAEKFEGMIGVIMVAAIALLAVALVWGIMTTGGAEPKWMQ